MVAFDVPLDLDSGAPAAVDTKYDFIQSVGRELPLQYHFYVDLLTEGRHYLQSPWSSNAAQ